MNESQEHPDHTAESLPVNEPERILPSELAPELLRQQLDEATRKAEENWDLLLRSRAEMENLRRRAERDLASAHKFALEKFARDLIPVADSLDLGMQAAGSDAPDVTLLREGVDLTYRLFLGVLEKHGATLVDPAGQRFNPELHQAMAMEPVDGVEPNLVLKVFQKGWLLNERLIRPAMVVVSTSV